jgi:anti-sigma B factor antagonist
MRLTLTSQIVADVVVIRCQGRIVAGPEVEALQAEVEKQTRIPGTNIVSSNSVVLQMGETDYIDSSGLGAIVRSLRVLQAAGGDLRLCQLSSPVVRVMEATQLASLFLAYATEQEAIEAFTQTPRMADAPVGSSQARIVCGDTSTDLLAYLHALLTRSGYEVFTSRHIGDAARLVYATRPRLVIWGPGLLALPAGQAAMEQFRRNRPDLQILQLPPEFSTAEAGEAGVDLIKQVQQLTA